MKSYALLVIVMVASLLAWAAPALAQGRKETAVIPDSDATPDSGGPALQPKPVTATPQTGAKTVSAAPILSGAELVRTGQFYFPRLQFQTRLEVPKKWNIHPIGDQKLRDAVRKLTNINILTDPVVVNLDSPDDLCKYPFVFMTSEGDFSFSDKNMKTLHEYLDRGGFLYADDCVALQQYDHFYTAFVREMARVYPDNPMIPIPQDHPVFRSYFQLDSTPFLQGVKHPAMGLFDKQSGRLMVMVTSGDIHCGWVGFGNLDRKECERSIQLGVNIIVYSLTH